MSEPKPKQNRIKLSSLFDFFLMAGLIGSLLLVLYVMPHDSFNFWWVLVFLIILVPTLRALVNGAPFVPTPLARAKKVAALAKIKPGEKVYDIGCGDGRMVYFAANEFGADATGLELSPLVYVLARIRKLFWRSKAKILFRDFHFYNLKDADVILCYLMPETLAKLQSKLEKELKKGARVVSYAFQIGNWKETHHELKDPANNLASIWVYER